MKPLEAIGCAIAILVISLAIANAPLKQQSDCRLDGINELLLKN